MNPINMNTNNSIRCGTTVQIVFLKFVLHSLYYHHEFLIFQHIYLWWCSKKYATQICQ